MKNESCEKWRRRLIVLIEDLRLFASLCIAEFIVWRILRRQRKERTERLKRIRTVPQRGMEPLSDLYGKR